LSYLKVGEDFPTFVHAVWAHDNGRKVLPYSSSKDVHNELAREAVDLALVDWMLLAGLRAAESAGVPTAVLMRTFHRYQTHDWRLGPIGIAAAVRSMRPRLAVERCRSNSGGDRFHARPRQRNGATGEHSLYGRRPGSHPARNPEDRPLVLVSLSTLFFEGQKTCLFRRK
jgi:hypothetical protein